VLISESLLQSLIRGYLAELYGLRSPHVFGARWNAGNVELRPGSEVERLIANVERRVVEPR
jgi:hypothetical protein